MLVARGLTHFSDTKATGVMIFCSLYMLFNITPDATSSYFFAAMSVISYNTFTSCNTQTLQMLKLKSPQDKTRQKNVTFVNVKKVIETDDVSG